MKLSELLSSPIKLIGGGFLNLKGFSKRVVDQELSKEITIDDIINFYTEGKIKKLSDLGTIITSTYNIRSAAIRADDKLFPYMTILDYSDDKSSVANMVYDIKAIAINGYFLMQAYETDFSCCLCNIDVEEDVINFICPIYLTKYKSVDGINKYYIHQDIMDVNGVVMI